MQNIHLQSETVQFLHIKPQLSSTSKSLAEKLVLSKYTEIYNQGNLNSSSVKMEDFILLQS